MVAADPHDEAKKKLYEELGDTIWDGIPYEYDDSKLPEITLDNPEVLAAVGALGNDPNRFANFLVDGPARNFGGKDRPKIKKGKVTQKLTGELVSDESGEETEASILLNPARSMWWLFNGRQYRVTKALMIPYEVRNKNGDLGPDGKDHITRHFLIGYMGVDSNG